MEKNGISLSHEYKLPRMRYKGNVVAQVSQADATLLLPYHVEACANNMSLLAYNVLLKVVRQHKRPIVREVKDVAEPPQIPLGFPSERKTQQSGTSADTPPIEPKHEQPATVFSFDRSNGNQQSQAQLEGNQLLGPSASASKGEVICISLTLELEAPLLPSPVTCAECQLSYEIYQEGTPVHTVWLDVSSPAGVSLEETSVKVKGDQLSASSHLHGPLAVALPFGVAASQASGQLTEDGTLRLTLPYAPLSEWIS